MKKSTINKSQSKLSKVIRISIFSFVILVISLSGIVIYKNWNNNKSHSVSNSDTLNKYDDVRTFITGGKEKTLKDISTLDLSKAGDIIPTLWFNMNTKWPSKMPEGIDPEDILNKAKNPGLGIRELHLQGITGKGVNVAIIDQPLYKDHPEFKGKIAAYKDFNCHSDSSMHGPAVASLLVGENTGTAPGARVYYAAAPSWNADAGYQAKALEWIIEENRKLKINDKIRVVSISAAPSGQGSPFTKNNDKWDKAVAIAEKEGILVLDCTTDHGIIGPAYFSDINNMDNIKNCMPGFPGTNREDVLPDKILVPTSPRASAEEYDQGSCSYQYTGRGGLSWAIPYCSGVLAMGWQLHPELTKDEIVDLLFKSAYDNDGQKIINPTEFIKMVKEKSSLKN